MSSFVSPKDCNGIPFYDTQEEATSFSFFEQFIPHLKRLAREALERFHLLPDAFALVCIEDCDFWEELIEGLSLNRSEQENAADETEGDYVFVCVATFEELSECLTFNDPAYAQRFKASPEPGMVRLLVFAKDGGVLIRDFGAYTPQVQ